jgi:hypothetical protein
MLLSVSEILAESPGSLSTHVTAHLIALCLAATLRDEGKPVPPMKELVAKVLREVRQ